MGLILAYWIGARGGRPLVERYGRWVLMSRHDLDRMTYFFEKYGSITILLGRLLPVVRTFIAFPAGIAKMPQLRFHIYTFIGSWPWCFALAYAGMKLGERWHTDPRFEQAFHRFHLGVEIVLEVPDLDAALAALVRAGGHVVEPIRERPWGLRDFRVLDPDGYYLRITTP